MAPEGSIHFPREACQGEGAEAAGEDPKEAGAMIANDTQLLEWILKKRKDLLKPLSAEGRKDSIVGGTYLINGVAQNELLNELLTAIDCSELKLDSTDFISELLKKD